MTDTEKKLLHRIEKLEEYAEGLIKNLEEYVERLFNVNKRHINLNLSAILLMAQKQGVDPEQLFDDAKQVQAIAKNLVGEVDE